MKTEFEWWKFWFCLLEFAVMVLGSFVLGPIVFLAGYVLVGVLLYLVVFPGAKLRIVLLWLPAVWIVEVQEFCGK